MRTVLTAAALAGVFCSAAVLAGPFDGLKSKMKPGMYESKTDMDMSQVPGMPAGMGPRSTTYQHCVTAEDIERAELGRSKERASKCEMKNLQISGNTATYQTVCTGPQPMTMDAKVTFRGDGYSMDMKMAMQGAHPMNMSSHTESHYLGPCTK